MKPADWRNRVMEAVREQGVVDAHHHMVSPAQRKESGVGLIDFMTASYLASDLAAAGLDWQALEGAGDADAWRAIAEVLPRTRYTSYYRVIHVAFHDLFDVRVPLWKADWRDLDEKIKAGSADETWTDDVLRRRVGLTHGVLDRHATGTTNHFLTTGYPDWCDFILRTRAGLA